MVPPAGSWRGSPPNAQDADTPENGHSRVGGATGQGTASGVHRRDGTAPGETMSPMRPDIRPGGIFPDDALPDHTGTVRMLSELQGRDPLILTLARGNYCPKEHRQHLELAANYPKVAVAYTQSPSSPPTTITPCKSSARRWAPNGPSCPIPGRTVQQDLDIQEYTDPEHNPMIPHTLVLKPGLVIHSVYNGYWFWGRPSFYDLWHDLRAATAEIRPDWDLSTPGLREAWDAGDYSKFHGWDSAVSWVDADIVCVTEQRLLLHFVAQVTRQAGD